MISVDALIANDGGVCVLALKVSSIPIQAVRPLTRTDRFPQTLSADSVTSSICPTPNTAQKRGRTSAGNGSAERPHRSWSVFPRALSLLSQDVVERCRAAAQKRPGRTRLSHFSCSDRLQQRRKRTPVQRPIRVLVRSGEHHGREGVRGPQNSVSETTTQPS